MAVERIYDAYQPQVEEQPKLRPQKKQVTHKQTVTKKVTVKLTRFEKMLYIALITIIAAISIYMLSLKMDAYDTRGKIADLDQKIEKQSSQNSALKSETMKNASYQRIYEKAEKQGMSLKNDNIKVVRKDGETKN
ncbi:MULTISPECIES: cell division protein FtsL [Staphylococcus]|uniref:Cell division protein FtsL n=1 Tax=Staphylococcus schleiferi TaxID=1295 RepID=A0A7Z7VXI6_STASC|nr:MULTISPECIES: cell division protein FtsL [Staphylococcus]QGS47261.1 cell division protein FtsL [Mammaliicoccus fleurettii]EPD52500.1 cell division protein FtsL [Staphylococcus sp. HGB0015]MBF1992682.1 cell division protein FtsL [Staphylococcus schleiferi]MBF2038308.1 cell division protein FtsL [Staphylococcus schleiferi]MBF2100254.1 cell division protein FtsL [Staphylococcus schleiferi]